MVTNLSEAKTQCDNHTVVMKQGLDCSILAKKTILEQTAVGADYGNEPNASVVSKANAGSENTELIACATNVNEEKTLNEIIAKSPIVGKFNHELVKSHHPEEGSRACQILNWMLNASIPKSVPLNGASLLIRLHMKKYGASPYNPVNMFIISLTRSQLSNDFNFHLAKIFIRNLFNQDRPLWQIYTTSKVFIKNLHEATLPCHLLSGITGMFLKELFECDFGTECRTTLVITITKVFLEHLFDERLSGYRTDYFVYGDNCRAARTFGEQLYGGELGEYLTMKITCLFANVLNMSTSEGWEYSWFVRSLFQGACKSNLNKKSMLKVVTIVTENLFWANKEIFPHLPGLATIFEASLPEDITVKIAKKYANTLLSHPDKEIIRGAEDNFLRHLFKASGNLCDESIIKIANKYVNIFTTHPDEEIVSDLAWSFNFKIIAYMGLSQGLKTKLAILVIKKILRSGHLTNDLISDIFYSFSALLLDCDNDLSMEATFGIAHVFIGRLFNAGLPDDVIFCISNIFLKKLFIFVSKHQGKAFEIAAMFTKTLLESSLSEETSMRIVHKFTYRLCDGHLPSDIADGYILHPVDPDVAFDIAAMFMGKLHEARLPEELEMKFINLLLVNLGLNTLSEELTFDMASMVLEYLNKTQLSAELVGKAGKILLAAAVQKCAMLSVGSRVASWQKSRGFWDGPTIMTSDQIYTSTVAEVVVSNGLDSDEEEDDLCQDDNSDDEDVNHCDILSNTVFNMTY